ncbi:MAG: AbgT family transporter [Planctomycetaceae bacterium]|nr:AbgT family transporter [Planctomycetaceae bacterium]
MLKRFLYLIEKGGNALPHPAILFGILALATLVLSAIGAFFAWHGTHPATNDQIEVVNLLSRDGIHRIILSMVTNFTSFAPLGIVLVAILGIGVAESSGLIRAAINFMLLKTPPAFITAMVVFAGVISSMAADVGYVLVIPLAGVIFHSLGRHPIAGLSAAFAGVSAGFSANIFLAPLDPMLAGISTEAAHIVDSTYTVLPTAYYYFMVVSTFLITIVCTLITEKWVEPRLGKYAGDVQREEIEYPTALEKKGLCMVGLVILGWTILLAIGLVPENGILRGDDGGLLNSPALRGIIALLFLSTASVGIVYGYTVGTFKKAEDVINAMGDNIKTLAGYLVLVFFAAQFVAWFNWSNLGLLLAINGASLLKDADIGLVPLIIIFVTFTGFINLFMGSASAKWALVGPIYVPIFMLLGYSPELAQSVYSVGDSVTNVITPLMPYFALIIVYYQKYDKNAGIGTIIATMLPFTILLYVSWTLLLIGWVLLEIPLGPGSPLYYGA